MKIKNKTLSKLSMIISVIFMCIIGVGILLSPHRYDDILGLIIVIWASYIFISSNTLTNKKKPSNVFKRKRKEEY